MLDLDLYCLVPFRVLPCTALYAVKYVRVRTFGHFLVLVRTRAVMYQPVPLCDIFQVVRTGTYYIILQVQVGTGRYVPVHTDMYKVYRIPDEESSGTLGYYDIIVFLWYHSISLSYHSIS